MAQPIAFCALLPGSYRGDRIGQPQASDGLCDLGLGPDECPAHLSGPLRPAFALAGLCRPRLHRTSIAGEF